MKKLIEKIVNTLTEVGVNIPLIEGDEELTTVYAAGMQLVISNKVIALVNEDGDTIKTYVKPTLAAKALAKLV